MTLFFVLSGYLITGLLVRGPGGVAALSLRTFWARRARRLVPAMAVFLPVAGVLLVVRADGDPAASLAVVGAPVMNVLRISVGNVSITGHLWSLAVEEQFYLVWPVLLMVVARAGSLRRRLLAMAVLATVWHCALVLADLGAWAYFGPDGNAYALLMGAVVAVSPRPTRPSPAVAGTALVLVVLASACGLPEPVEAGLQPLVAVAGAWLVRHAGRLELLSWSPLTYTGRVSYGWYLWHVPLLELARAEGLGAAVVADLISLAIATLSFRVVEAPFLGPHHAAPTARSGEALDACAGTHVRGSGALAMASGHPYADHVRVVAACR